MDFDIFLPGGAGGGAGRLQERKRSRAQPPEGWLGESRSVKKRQVRRGDIWILTECRNIADNILSLSRVEHSHWFIEMKYLNHVATPALLCHKEPAQGMQSSPF